MTFLIGGLDVSAAKSVAARVCMREDFGVRIDCGTSGMRGIENGTFEGSGRVDSDSPASERDQRTTWDESCSTVCEGIVSSVRSAMTLKESRGEGHDIISRQRKYCILTDGPNHQHSSP